jgi:RHS repeat-associated protein
VLLVVATCGSTADVPSARRENPAIPVPPVEIELPENPIVAGTSVGYLAGSPEVSPTGEMTYTLPLDVPPGIAGMEPHLALSYSSRAGSGPIGRGWSLAGGSSSITRCPKSLAVNDTRDGVDFDGTDGFCLDGQQLVSVGPGEYRTENDSIARILMDGSPAAPTSFTVFLKNGRNRTYEALAPAQRVSATELSLTAVAPVVLDWPIKDEADRSGNVIHYFYQHNPKTVVPYDEENLLDRIEYTDGPGGASARRSVVFEYGVRPDKSFAYHHGIRYQLRTRLTGIKMLAPNPTVKSLVWEYKLAYVDQQYPLLGRSLLDSVQKCGFLGTCTFAKHLGWSYEGFPNLYEPVSRPFAGLQQPTDMLTFDANGDGRDDVLYRVLTTDVPAQVRFHLFLSQSGPGLAPYQDIVVGGSGLGTPLDDMIMGGSRAVDLDGDGRVDLLVDIKAPVVDTGDGAPVPLDPDAAFDTFQPVHFTDADQHFHIFGSQIKASSVNLVDVNGDSLLDVVSYKKPATYLVALSNGAAGWVSQGTITSPVTTCPLGRSGGDLDADGRGELLIPTANDCSTSVTVGLDDSGAVVATPSLAMQRDHHEVQLADLNGDGLVDAFWLGDTLEISFNTGNGYGPPHTTSDPALDSVLALNLDSTKRSAIVMDVNRDGRDDLLFTVRDHTTFTFGDALFHHNDAVVALLSNGDGSFTREDLLDVDPGLGLRTADFDGDGRKDLFAVTADGSLQIFLEHGDDDADLLSSVWDDDASSEPRLQVAYGRTNPADWASATCSFPTLCLRQGSLVVASVSGLDVGTKTTYRFEEPRLDLGGRGFLGYGTVRVWNPARPMERTTTFDNVTRVGTVYPNAQRPKSMRTIVPIVNHGAEGIVDKVVSGNARISETTFEYELRAPLGGPSHFVFTHATHEHEWEESVAIDWNDTTRVHITAVDGPGLQGAPREHNASFRVDDYNNLLSVSEGTVGGVIHTAEYTYDYRPALWLVGLQATRSEGTYDAGQTPDVIHVLNHHDLLGRLDVSTVEPGGDPDVTVVRSLDYDTRGRLIQETRTTAGQPARTRHFDYSDPSGEGVFMSQQWDDVGGAITLSKWMYAVPGFGGTMGIIDANGGVATTVHDDLGRPILVTGAGKKPATIAYSAWKHNADIVHPGGVTAGVEVEVHDGGDAWQVVDTDARGLEVERRRAGFHGLTVVTNAGYDRFGRVLWQSRPDWGTASLARTERVYDSLDRVLSVVAPDGALSTQSYTFFERTATDPQQRVRKIVQDADRRVVTAIDVHDGQPLETTYLYVHGSQPEWVIDPQGNMIHSVFDVRGRRTLLEDPDAGTRASRYDGFGDVVQTGDGAGNTTTYTLDQIGRATTIESDTDGTTTLTWDTQPHGLGQIAQTVSPDHTIVDSYYDSIGRPTKTDWTVPGPVVSMFSFEQSYDLDGHVSELRYPYALNRSRMVVTPHHDDGAGGVSLIEATDALGYPFEVWEATDRNADNSLTAAKLGTSMDTARSYDALTGRLATIATSGGDGSIVDLTFGYYSDGRLHVKNDRAAGRAESFEYDDLRRLTAWSLIGDSVTNYEYDPLGNLTGVRDEHGVQTEANAYSGDGPHQLNGRDGVEYTYDKRGRLRESTEGLSITYTDFDLPRSYTKDGVTTDFNYDAGHHRVRKAGPSGTTITLGGLYERREDASGTKHVFNIGGPDGMIAQVVYDQGHESEEVEYLHQDQLGSVAVATSPEGKEIDRLFYEPFGRRIDKNGNLLSGPASDVLTGFTGQRHDDELGLIDMRGRTYDPILRRFLQPDPVVTDAYEGQSYNRYSYVRNDPANRTDPTGMADDAKLDNHYGNGGVGDSDAAAAGLGDTTPAALADGSKEIVIHGQPRDKSGDHLGTDSNGEGAAVQGEAAIANTSYQSSSTDQGLNAGGGGGTGGGPNVGPTGLCGGCTEKDAFSYFYQYGGYVQNGLVYMAATATAIAAAAVVLPAMTIGGLATGGAGLLEGAAVAAAPVASAATGAAAAAGTPTGQAVLEEAEGAGASFLRFAHGTDPSSVESIKQGLSADAAAAASLGGTALERGSFFAMETVGEGLQIAYEMGIRQNPNPAVMIGQIPMNVAESLMESGQLRSLPFTGAPPGVEQLVFSPASFATFNDNVQWLQVLYP